MGKSQWSYTSTPRIRLCGVDRDYCTFTFTVSHDIIIITLGISFMQGIYTYIPETNHVPREHRVAAIVVLLFMVLISLVPALTSSCLYVSTFRSMCAVPNMAVFCSSVTSWFPGILLTYFLNDFEVVIIIIIIIIIIIQHYNS